MDKVLVLLSTYNGALYLEEQLISLVSQKGVSVSILVRDDGSTDGTRAILEKWQSQGKLKWYTGDNIGPAHSFLDLIYRAEEIDYYAFCDQDDVWMENKLKVAIEKMNSIGADLYYSSYSTTDNSLKILAESVQKPVINTLAQALVYASVTGCTMVFTQQLAKVVKRYMPSKLMMHDSWLFKIALALEHKIYYDKQSYILYRQHGNNVIGDHKSWYARWKGRMIRIMKSDRKRYDEMKELYEGYNDIMPADQLQSIIPLLDYYKRHIWYRIRVAFNKKYVTGVTHSDNLFKIAILLKKF